MKAIVKAVIAGSAIIGAGIIILIVALALNGWSFTPEFEMAQYAAEGGIGELKIENAAGNVRTEFYDGDKLIVDYPVSSRYEMTVTEHDGVLSVDGLNRKHWYNFTVLPYMLPETVVKIPQSMRLKLNLTVNAGKVELAAGEYAETAVTVNAGSVNVSGIRCPDFKCKVNAGAVSLDALDCATFECNINAGSFYAGQMNCPLIRLGVSAGSADMKIQGGREEYTVFVDKSAGSCNVTDQTGSDPAKKIEIRVSAGSVSASFV